jgi:hypothetical protein
MPSRYVFAVVALAALLGVIQAPHEPAPATAAGAAHAPAADLTYRDLVMAANGCGSERWAVKTGSDADRNSVSTVQHQTTIAALRSLTKPSSLPSDRRISPTELREFVIAGTLTEYKSETDSDIHLIIADGSGHTVIGEIPSTGCVVAARFKTEIARVRQAFLARFPASSSFRSTHTAIRVRGIGFFDYAHRQTGAAPNGIELHPVLGLGFP